MVETPQSQAAPAKPSGLYGALLKAQQEIAAIEKTQRVKFGAVDYKTATCEDVFIEAARVLHAAGIFAGCVGWKTEWYAKPPIVPQSGEQQGGEVSVRFRVAFPPTGESFEDSFDFPIILQRGRDTGKSEHAAVTTATKIYYLRLLNVPRVEEGLDNDLRPCEPPAAPPPRQPRPIPPPREIPPAPPTPHEPVYEHVDAECGIADCSIEQVEKRPDGGVRWTRWAIVPAGDSSPRMVTFSPAVAAIAEKAALEKFRVRVRFRDSPHGKLCTWMAPAAPATAPTESPTPIPAASPPTITEDMAYAVTVAKILEARDGMKPGVFLYGIQTDQGTFRLRPGDVAKFRDIVTRGVRVTLWYTIEGRSRPIQRFEEIPNGI